MEENNELEGMEENLTNEISSSRDAVIIFLTTKLQEQDKKLDKILSRLKDIENKIDGVQSTAWSIEGNM